MPSPLDAHTARRIALAAIIQAVIDASYDDPGAESWLLSTGFEWMLGAGVYIDPGKIRKKFRTGFNRAEVNRLLATNGAHHE